MYQEDYFQHLSSSFYHTIQNPIDFLVLRLIEKNDLYFVRHIPVREFAANSLKFYGLAPADNCALIKPRAREPWPGKSNWHDFQFRPKSAIEKCLFCKKRGYMNVLYMIHDSITIHSDRITIIHARVVQYRTFAWCYTGSRL